MSPSISLYWTKLVSLPLSLTHMHAVPLSFTRSHSQPHKHTLSLSITLGPPSDSLSLSEPLSAWSELKLFLIWMLEVKAFNNILISLLLMNHFFYSQRIASMKHSRGKLCCEFSVCRNSWFVQFYFYFSRPVWFYISKSKDRVLQHLSAIAFALQTLFFTVLTSFKVIFCFQNGLAYCCWQQVVKLE